MGAPIIATGGLRKLNRDLRKMSADAPKMVRNLIREELQPMARHANSRAPGTGKTIGVWRAVARGSSGALTNSHPGAKPWEFGGHIAPKGGKGLDLLPAAQMVYGKEGALEARKEEVERGLISGLERLARENGWH